jgi:hypothetical protein
MSSLLKKRSDRPAAGAPRFQGAAAALSYRLAGFRNLPRHTIRPTMMAAASPPLALNLRLLRADKKNQLIKTAPPAT